MPKNNLPPYKKKIKKRKQPYQTGQSQGVSSQSQQKNVLPPAKTLFKPQQAHDKFHNNNNTCQLVPSVVVLNIGQELTVLQVGINVKTAKTLTRKHKLIWMWKMLKKYASDSHLANLNVSSKAL